MSMNIETPVIERLREWLTARNKDLTRDALSLDFDLIKARAVDSLSSLEFVLFIEELSGREMDMAALKHTENFRTLRSIYNAFLSHLTPAAVTDHADHSDDAATLSV
jgi:acyl carrier protein